MEVQPTSAEVLEFLVASATAELSAAGLDGPVLQALATMQANARITGHAHSHPAAAQQCVAAAHGAFVGRMLVSRAEVWHLVDLVVHPDVRRSGLATWMLGQLLDEATSAGATVELLVRRGGAAEEIYRRAGFIAVASHELDMEYRWEPPGAAM